MKNIIKKILIVCIVISLCSCSIVNKFVGDNSYNRIDNLENATNKDYIQVLRNYHVRDKNKNNTELNKEFEDFLHEFVVEMYEDSYISIHYDFVDYKSFGITKPDVTWGEVEEDTDEKIKEAIEDLKKLQNFDYDSLSYRQQFDFETLEYSMYEDLANLSIDFEDRLLFDSRTDLLSSIISNLTDFTFYNIESLDDYMILLADTDRYLEDAIDYTNKVAEESHYYMIDASIDNAIDYIDSLISAKPNVLVSSFDERINKLDFISSNDKSKYKEENKKIVKEEIVPVIKKVKETVEAQRGKTTSYDNRLVNISEEFAETSFLLDTSSNKDIDTIFEDSCYVLVDMVNEIIPLLNDETVINDLKRIENGEVEPLNSNFNKMLEFLEDNYTKTNTDLGYINYDLSSIDESSASGHVLAYYWPSPIDMKDQNVIKYNPKSITGGDPSEAYFTLSHEAIPGHMYDYYRSLLNEDNPIRRSISYIGVTEGYAMYSEICAASYLDVDEKTQKYLYINEVCGYIYDGILDLAINYYNYSDEDLAELIRLLGFNDGDLEYLKDFFADEYGLLTRYGIGLASILHMKKDTMEALGDSFDEVEFNDLLTRNGRLPFVIIEDEINKYVKEKLDR